MTSNLFTDLPSNLPDKLFTTLLEATKLRIERIVSEGHSSSQGFWYDQDQNEWVVVLKGGARMSIEGIVKVLRPLVCNETGALAGVLATTYESSGGSSDLMSDEALQHTIREILSSYSESEGDGIHTFVGNEPDEVIVQIKGSKLAISVFSRRWDGPSSLVVHPIPIATLNWRRIPFDLLKTELTSLIETARKIRRSKFRKCLKCGDTKPPEWMHDEQTCQSCSGAIY